MTGPGTRIPPAGRTRCSTGSTSPRWPGTASASTATRAITPTCRHWATSTYPYGRYDERVRQAAIDAGYAAAFSVQPGFNRPGLDPYRIRRLDVYGTDTAAALARKMALGTNDGSVAHTARYAVGRAAARLGLRDR